jgi:hypothetical protein
VDNNFFISYNNLKISINAPYGGRIQQIYYDNKPLFYNHNINNDDLWINFGGDFLWIAPQDKWGNWPPPKEFDCLPWSVKNTKSKTTITSLEYDGIILERTIYFVDNSIRVENSILNNSNQPKEWALWNISQFPVKNLSVNICLKSLKIFDYPENINEELLFSSNQLFRQGCTYTVLPKHDLDFKIGGVSIDNYIVCKYDNLTVKKRIFLDNKDESNFPHQCSIEIYKNNDYLEAELLWPMVQLKPQKKFIGIQEFTIEKE